MLPYKITIEIAAMARPLDEVGLLKAAVANEIAWKVGKMAKPPYKVYAAAFGALSDVTSLAGSRYSKDEKSLGGLTRMSFVFGEMDPNNIGFYLGMACEALLKSKSRGYDYVDAQDFCKRFKCAMKITVVELEENGHWICDWYAPDGKSGERVEGEKSEPSESLEEFLREWSREK